MQHTNERRYYDFDAIDSFNTIDNTTTTSERDEQDKTDTIRGIQEPEEMLEVKTKCNKGKEKVIDHTQSYSTQHNCDNAELDIVHQKQQKESEGTHLFPGEPILCQLLQAANLFEKLDLKDVLSLTLLSTQIFKQLSPLISNHYMLQYHDNTNIQHYHPKKLLVTTHNLQGLFNHPLLSNLYKIKFDKKYNFAIPSLPDSVTHVTLADDFNQEITSLPYVNITHLTLGKYFNSKITNLPLTIIYLKFDYHFDQPISTSNLPPHLETLILGFMFNQPITQLPETLKSLTFAGWFNHPIDGLLPSNLTHLFFYDDSYFNKPVNSLPQKLRHLELGYCFSQSISNLPHSITHLKLGAKFDFAQYGAELPPKLTHLEFGWQFSQYIPSLPAKVKQILFPGAYNFPVDHLSKDIQFLSVTFTYREHVAPYQYKAPSQKR
eukprot:TRINITY_DN1662_c0_g1_i11.p1 TRINITY_DN1662_c0_g1~~TRINITY_DN1662_c0_g1_i11.p1  ORF type:complete len:434 (-),score=80.95 TRINITY_DN1662_c0_g1_i11:100-1401(-)